MNSIFDYLIRKKYCKKIVKDKAISGLRESVFQF